MDSGVVGRVEEAARNSFARKRKVYACVSFGGGLVATAGLLVVALTPSNEDGSCSSYCKLGFSLGLGGFLVFVGSLLAASNSESVQNAQNEG